jgi:protein-L-isoaspartate(D-aspartate) O-methyltransferase
MSANLELARRNMIEQQVRPWDVLDERVLEALAAVRREDFVPPAYRNLAFADLDLPLGHGEVMLRPVLEGRLLQAAAPQPEERVLEIGTGSGFFTACLARLAGEVTSVEQHAEFVEAARARLHAANVRNARLELGEAVRTWRATQPFDVMVVTGAVHALPPHWGDWIRPGGRLVAIVGESPAQRAVRCTRTAAGLATEELFETDVPYLRHAEPPARFTL